MGENFQPNPESDVIFKKVSISVSKKSGLEKSLSLGLKKFRLEKALSLGLKKFSLKKSLGIRHENIWSRKKKSQYRSRKYLVSKKVSVSVSKTFGLKKKSRHRSRKYLVSKKVSVSVSNEISGLVTQCLEHVHNIIILTLTTTIMLT